MEALETMRVIDRQQAKVVAGFNSTTRANARLLGSPAQDSSSAHLSAAAKRFTGWQASRCGTQVTKAETMPPNRLRCSSGIRWKSTARTCWCSTAASHTRLVVCPLAELSKAAVSFGSADPGRIFRGRL
jgi:hypothetical protein